MSSPGAVDKTTPRGYVPVGSQAPEPKPETRTAAVIEDQRNRAIKALGTPILENDIEGEISKATRDGVINATELRTIWGIGQDQLAGLDSYGVSCDGKDGQDDGLTIGVGAEGDDEIGTLIEHKKEVELHRFQRIMSGAGKEPAELEILFDELYSLAFKGELTREAWNEKMMANGLPGYKMNIISFKCLLGNRDGGDENDRVEGFTEFSTALFNIERTLQAQVPPTQVHPDDHREENYVFYDQDPDSAGADIDRFKQYSQIFAKYCDARYFHNQDTGAFDAMIEGSLALGAPADYVMPSNSDEIFRAIQDGVFGDKLAKMVEDYDIQSWEELSMFLQYLMQKGIEEDSNRDDDYSRNINMRAKHTRRIWALIDNGADGEMKAKTKLRYEALQAEMRDVILNGGKVVHFDNIRMADRTAEGDEE
ncbi:MAG: hypothetical protein WC890_01320 [Candidatus Margulisiibacteriota bacterium]